MSTCLRYWAIIPAAGNSQRMGGNLAKQYLPIHDATVIEYALQSFLRYPDILGVIVALDVHDQHWEQLEVAKDKKVHTVIGGKTRAESVYQAIQYLDSTSAEDDDYVLVHDAARPCLRYSDLERLIVELQEQKVGGILAAPVTDTLKLSDEQECVSQTLKREKIWRALTPQMFRLMYLREAMHYCLQEKITITDEASAIEEKNLPVKLVKGASDNIKITHQEDFLQAEAILKEIYQ